MYGDYVIIFHPARDISPSSFNFWGSGGLKSSPALRQGKVEKYKNVVKSCTLKVRPGFLFQILCLGAVKGWHNPSNHQKCTSGPLPPWGAGVLGGKYWGDFGQFEGDPQVLPGGTLEVKNLSLGGHWGQMASIPFLKYCTWAFQ